MPRLWMLSDLHFECYPEDRRSLPAPDFDVLVVAGDIWESEPEKAVDQLVSMSGGRPVVATLGNHDHWHLEMEDAVARMKAAAQGRDVFVLDAEEIELEGIRFFGASLWPDLEMEVDSLSPVGEPIMMGGRPLTPSDAKAIRLRDLEALRSSCADVVLTHYGPEPALIEHAPRLWLSGHYHGFHRYEADGIEFVRNPRQSRVFADRMVISIEPSPAMALDA